MRSNFETYCQRTKSHWTSTFTRLYRLAIECMMWAHIQQRRTASWRIPRAGSLRRRLEKSRNYNRSRGLVALLLGWRWETMGRRGRWGDRTTTQKPARSRGSPGGYILTHRRSYNHRKNTANLLSQERLTKPNEGLHTGDFAQLHTPCPSAVFTTHPTTYSLPKTLQWRKPLQQHT